MEVKTKLSFEDTSVAFEAQSTAKLRQTYTLFALINRPWMVKVGTGAVKLAFQLGLPIKGVVKKTIYAHFCGGENIEESQPTVKQLADFHIGTILDFSVEGQEDEASYDAAMEETIRTIEAADGNPAVPFSVFKVTGLGPTQLLVKVQAKGLLSEEEKAAWERVQNRVERICQRGFDLGVPIFIDAEETWLQQPIDMLANRMMSKFNKERAIIYNTYQLYAKASLENFKKDFDCAQQSGYYLGAKLVRGAYMEKERERAQEHGYDDPIQPNKAATDADYNRALEFAMTNLKGMYICAGSHNEKSNLYLTELMDKADIDAQDPRIFFAQLYGMSDHISYPLAKAGFNVAKYVPYGPVKKVMPYLFRRAEENTSVAGQSGREFTLVKKEMARRRRK
ncbi:MAG TPA: proline dehydrogenase [Cytophagales bacterium]|nr:proline dehydrogenase [Cytophagales bacterium]